MTRIYPDFTYGPGPRGTCWWDETTPAQNWPALDADLRVDVAIIGAGFTGANAALRLAEAGLSVAVFEAGAPGWGASGRNGGFCCLGGGRISNARLTQLFGDEGRRHYRKTELEAVHHVSTLLGRHGIQADTHSEGETLLAHRARSVRVLSETAERAAADYGVAPKIVAAKDLAALGMSGAHFGAVTIPVGFALNPRKYLFGVVDAAVQSGAQFFANTEVLGIAQEMRGYALATKQRQILADQVIVATNGYSSENLPPWLSARFLPAQSSVLVTRPLQPSELAAQGWTTRQMCYDSRNLLHYFRLMPDNRMLFGMRGGVLSSPRSEAAALTRVRRDFERFFPAWAHVETPFGWSGMVCMARNDTPFVGPVPDAPGMFAAFAYHGNGVAMGSYAGHLLAGLMLGEDAGRIPAAMRATAKRYPLGVRRRALLPAAYLGFQIADM